jgi:hypothetical protein
VSIYAADALAHSNPALSALVIYSFVRGFQEQSKVGPNYALAFLPVPIALSRPLAATFEGTQVRTGLLLWLERMPWIRLELAEHLRDAKRISRAGLVFGLQRRVFVLDESARLSVQAGHLFREPKDLVGLDIAERPHAVAARLGAWCAQLPDAAAVFAALEVAP